jgi:hypothetical protein
VDPVRDGTNWFAYVNNDPVNYIDLWGLSGSDNSASKYSGLHDEYNPVLKVEALKINPVSNEQSLSLSAVETAKKEGWVDITKNQDERNEAAIDLKEKVLDTRTSSDWFVIVRPIRTNYFDTHERTINEGALLNAEDGKSLPGIKTIGSYDGTEYEVYPYDPDTGEITNRPYKQYYDIDGNGRIDFKK